MFGLKADWSLDVFERYFTIGDYAGGEARWCPGCGDHGILTSVQRVLRDEQIAPEKTVAVSGIGCSSRMPHYLGTFGFHGLHGRSITYATGIKLANPGLHVEMGLLGVLIVDADAAFDRDRHIHRRAHGRDTVGDEVRLLHELIGRPLHQRVHHRQQHVQDKPADQCPGDQEFRVWNSSH